MSRPAAPDAGAPPWFDRALARAPEHREVEVAGARVHYRAWGDGDAPGLVLVHGGAAHSGWWDHVAPLLGSHRVVAVDLSGHGDSSWRPEYTMSLWAQEVLAVAAAEGLDRPVVLGHSMGGWVTLTAAVEHGPTLAGAAVIDSPLAARPPEESRAGGIARTHRVYADPGEAVARFRTLPPQEEYLPYVMAHVARGSLRAAEGGWTWKFDPGFFGPRPDLRDVLPRLATPAALFRCERGLVGPGMAAEMAGLAPAGLTVVDLPEAGHHPMLDQPLALVTAVRTLLALWPDR
ncbi:alpha/beta fold hydrolase [Geodermatophilus sp. SYSU D00758]